jgi:hypothetical protein
MPLAARIGFFVSALLICPAVAQSTAEPPAPQTESIDALIAKLGNADWRAREAAAEALMNVGPDAYEPLRKAFQGQGTYELRRRIREVVKDIWLTQSAGPGYAFLGVRLKPADLRIPPGVGGQVISGALEGTGAERAGLQPDDVLLSINGKALNADNYPTGLPGWTKAQKPGTIGRIGFLRGGEAILVPSPHRASDRQRLARLDLRPVSHADDERVPESVTALKLGPVDPEIRYGKLREGDLILSVDAEPLQPDTAKEAFARWTEGLGADRSTANLRTPAPRTPVDGPMLQVLRGGQWMEVDVVLLRVPERLQHEGFLKPERVRAEPAFALWWQQTFDPDGRLAGGRAAGDDPSWRLVPRSRRR